MADVFVVLTNERRREARDARPVGTEYIDSIHTLRKDAAVRGALIADSGRKARIEEHMLDATRTSVAEFRKR